MDQTPLDESYSETSSDFLNSFSKEISDVTNISDKEILTLQTVENEILTMNLLNPILTQENNIFNVDLGNIIKVRKSRQSAKEQQAEIREVHETEQKVSKNIENLQIKIKDKENELGQCAQEAKLLCKEHKSAEALIHKIKHHFQQNFGIKLDSEETDGGFIAHVYLSDEQNVKPVKLFFDNNNQNISLLQSDYLPENQWKILQESLEDEKQIVPVFCILREILLNEY